MSLNKNFDFLESLIVNDSIQIVNDCEDWIQAIEVCFKPLVDNKRIKNDYIKSVIENTKNHGPYYIICPNVAMPHTNPNDGSLGTAFSLMTLKKPVKFDLKNIRLLIGFCAIDSKTHLESALPQIVAVFENPEIVEKIINSKSKREIIEIIRKIDYSKYIGG